VVMGMTRDELFDEFSRFVSARVAAARRTTADASAEDGEEPGADRDDEPRDAVVVERAQPAKVHAKAKAKKRR
jgi:hypothetical protein